MPTKKEVTAFVKAHGCFCGGDGAYTNYNCGADFLVKCPHCQGTGKKQCACTEVALVCEKFGHGHEIDNSFKRGDDGLPAHWRDDDAGDWRFDD